MKQRRLLFGCIVASLFIHLLALVCFQRYSLGGAPPHRPNYNEIVEKKERDQILKVAFESSHQRKKEATIALQPQVAVEPSMILHASIHSPLPELTPSPLFLAPLPIHDLLVPGSPLPVFSVPTSPFDLLHHLPQDFNISTPSQNRPSPFHPLPSKSLVHFNPSIPQALQNVPYLTVDYVESVEADLTEEPRVTKAPSPNSFPHLPKLPTLDELDTSSYSDSFDAELIFIEQEGEGYIFALTLIPRPDLELAKVKQHFTFLIDRANSIQQDRLHATKVAVRKAIEEMSEEDTFNIIAFDSKMEKMAPQSVYATKQSIAKAEEFLEKIQLGSFFSSSELFKPLFLTLPNFVKSDELHTVILLTDGEVLTKKNGQRSLLYDWTQMNNGRVTLYTLGLNTDQHNAVFDIACTYNKGKFISSPTKKGIKRRLLKLMKSIHSAVAKDITCKVISRSPNASIQCLPLSASNLYLDQPFVILGESKTLDDFILFVQGRLRDRWLNIKKNISFVNARKAAPSLKQEWALQRALDLYKSYLTDENPETIAKIQSLTDMKLPLR